jgi:hypothetical protein
LLRPSPGVASKFAAGLELLAGAATLAASVLAAPDVS